MTHFYITHTSLDGERHQLTGMWSAETPEEAIETMLGQAGAEDDGCWEAHPVTDESEIIQ